jgi:hypothetical protein
MRSIIVVIVLLVITGVAFGQTELEKAKDAYRSGRFSESVSILEKAIATGDAKHPIPIWLSASYVQTGDNEKAKSLLNNLSRFKAADPSNETRAKIIKQPQPILGDDGEIRVFIELKADGKVGFVFPYKMTSKKLIEGATKAAQRIEFEPATLNGKPVTDFRMLVYSRQTDWH